MPRADILGNLGRANVRAAIKLVTDTFYVTPIKYYIAQESLDRFSEDKEDQEWLTFDLLGFVEYAPTASVTADMEGAANRADIKVSFNLEDLIAVGDIIDPVTKQPIFNENTDKMDINGVTYRVGSVTTDGALDNQNVLVVINARNIINKT